MAPNSSKQLQMAHLNIPYHCPMSYPHIVVQCQVLWCCPMKLPHFVALLIFPYCCPKVLSHDVVPMLLSQAVLPCGVLTFGRPMWLSHDVIPCPHCFPISLAMIFSCPEQLQKSSCRSVCRSFLKKLPLEYQMVTKTYLSTYLPVPVVTIVKVVTVVTVET